MSVIVGDIPRLGMPVFDMKDGEIAQVVECRHFPSNVGNIVMRNADRLIVLGKDFSFTSCDVFSRGDEGYRVRILPIGTKLEIAG